MKPLMLIFIGVFILLSNVKAQTNTVLVTKIKTSAVCDMCKTRIEEGLFTQKGIVSAILNLETKIVTVKYRGKKITEEQIRNYISSIGYDADTVAADKAAYDILPGCCKIGGMH